MTHVTAPSYDQDGWRFRDGVPDPSGVNAAFDASDTAANTDVTLNVDTLYRVRIVVKQTDAAADDTTNLATEFRLQYNNVTQATGWVNVSDEGGGGDVEFTTPTGFTEGDNTTQLVGGGTFITGHGCFDNQTATCTFTTSAATETELEFCFTINGSDVANNDEIDLRVLYSNADESPPATVLGAYTAIPTITVSEVTPPTGTSAFDALVTTQAASGEIGHAFVESSFDAPVTTQTGSGTAVHESDTADTSIPITTQDATGTAGSEPSGTGEFTALVTTQTGAGTATHESDTADTTVPVTTQTGQGEHGVAFQSSALTIPLVTQTGTGEIGHEFLESSFDIPLVTQAGSGTASSGDPPSGTSAMTIPLSVMAGSGPFSIVTAGSWSATASFQPGDSWRVLLSGPSADNVQTRIVVSFRAP